MLPGEPSLGSLATEQDPVTQDKGLGMAQYRGPGFDALYCDETDNFSVSSGSGTVWSPTPHTGAQRLVPSWRPRTQHRGPCVSTARRGCTAPLSQGPWPCHPSATGISVSWEAQPQPTPALCPRASRTQAMVKASAPALERDTAHLCVGGDTLRRGCPFPGLRRFYPQEEEKTKPNCANLSASPGLGRAQFPDPAGQAGRAVCWGWGGGKRHTVLAHWSTPSSLVPSGAVATAFPPGREGGCL